MNNEFKLIGTVNDKENHTTQKGSQIVTLTVAVDSGFGEYKRTDLIKVKTLGNTASRASHIALGQSVIVMGSLQSRTYSKEGKDLQFTDLIGNHIHLINNAALNENDLY